MPDGGDASPVVVDRNGPVLSLRLNRPRALNAITIELATSLARALTEEARSADVRVVVVRGEGGNFSVGGDFDEVSRLAAEGRAALQRLFDSFAGACEQIATLPVPVVAAVEGYAMAGGFELMQACDLAVVRDDAVIADNHVNFGLIPGGGSTQRLPRLVGRQRALGHILTGDRLTGTDAVSWGLAYESAPAGTYDDALETILGRLVDKSADAVAAAKNLVYEGLAAPLQEGLARERRAIVEYLRGEAGRRALASFSDRRGDDR